MLKKPNKELEIDILEVDDYVELFGKPNDTFNEQDQEFLYRLIKQATQQFDSLLSPHGEVGFLYRWWKNLQDVEEDNLKGLRLQKAIGSWVETMVQNGKFWVDGVPNMNSNIDYSLKTSYSNSNIESKRKDIIQDLVAIGLTITTNLGLPTNINQPMSDKELDELVIFSKQWITNTFLALDSQSYKQSVISAINMNNNDIQNCGNIYSLNSTNKPTLTNFRLIGCKVLLDDANEIEATKVESTDKILDTKDNTYKFLSQFDVKYFGGLTSDEIYQAIWAAGGIWKPTLNYAKDFIVMFPIKTKKNVLYGFAMSKVNNNIGNDPNTSPNAWEILPATPIEINAVIEWTKEYIDTKILPQLQTQITNEIDTKLENLPTIDNIIYPKNTWVPFKDKATFENEVKQPYNLKENIDYKVLDTTFIGQNDNDNVVGDNLIKQSDLPNLNFTLWTTEYDFGATSSLSKITSTTNIVDWSDSTGESWRGIQANNKNMDGEVWTWYLNNNVQQTPFIPQHTGAYYVMFIKNITKKSVIKIGSDYTGIVPINVDNNTKEISIDDNNYAKLDAKNNFTNDNTFKSVNVGKTTINDNGIQTTYISNLQTNLIVNNNDATNKEYVDNAVANATPQDYDIVKQQVETNKQDISTINQTLPTKLDTTIFNVFETKINQEQLTQNQSIDNNKLAIENNAKNLEQLNQYTPKLIDGYVIEPNKTYAKNMMGYVLVNTKAQSEKWLLSIVDNASGADVDNTTIWKPIEAPVSMPQMDNYYTKQETNDLLLPLETRLQTDESDINALKTNKMDVINNSNDIGYNKTANTLYITTEWKDKINNKQDILNDNTLEIKPKSVNLGNNIEIKKYSNNELLFYSKEKMSFVFRDDALNETNRIEFNKQGKAIKLQDIEISNFEYQSKKYSAFKVNKNGNLLQFEVNIDDKVSKLNAPTATTFLIENLSTPTLPHHAATKEYVDSKSGGGVTFYKGQTMFFETKALAQEFVKELGLVENTDFKYTPTGRYFYVGNSGSNGGDSKISMVDLPYKEWGFDLTDRYTGGSPYSWLLSFGSLISVSKNNISQNGSSCDISTNGGRSVERQQLRWNYGDKNQAQYKPNYVERCELVFLKKVVK